jgi:transforming growth factor-beta-induced protein
MKRLLLVLSLALLLGLGVGNVARAEGTIVDIAVNDGRFETLVTALQKAELVEALQGDGPFTVFAPTDDAFALLPEGTIPALLEDVPALKNVLLYHVVEGKVLAADVVNLTSATTLLGKDVAIEVRDGNVFINDAQVIITDIEADNGVIHVINAVLLPPADPAVLPQTGGQAGPTNTWTLFALVGLGLLGLATGAVLVPARKR